VVQVAAAASKKAGRPFLAKIIPAAYYCGYCAETEFDVQDDDVGARRATLSDCMGAKIRRGTLKIYGLMYIFFNPREGLKLVGVIDGVSGEATGCGTFPLNKRELHQEHTKPPDSLKRWHKCLSQLYPPRKLRLQRPALHHLPQVQ
jgi:hypothetical protein